MVAHELQLDRGWAGARRSRTQARMTRTSASRYAQITEATKRDGGRA